MGREREEGREVWVGEGDTTGKKRGWETTTVRLGGCIEGRALLLLKNIGYPL